MACEDTTISKEKGENHPDHCDQKAHTSGAKESIKVGFQPDDKEQEGNPDLGKKMEFRDMGIHKVEEGGSEEDPEKDLAQHRRLFDPLKQGSKDPGSHRDEGDQKEEMGDRESGMGVHRSSTGWWFYGAKEGKKQTRKNLFIEVRS
jgi:hypothetical protein